MDELSFPAMVLIEKACPPGLMIDPVEQRRDEEEEKIKKLNHVSIHDVDRLIKRPFAVEGRFTSTFNFGINWIKMRLNITSAMSSLSLNSLVTLIFRNCYVFGKFGEILWDFSFV